MKQPSCAAAINTNTDQSSVLDCCRCSPVRTLLQNFCLLNLDDPELTWKGWRSSATAQSALKLYSRNLFYEVYFGCLMLCMLLPRLHKGSVLQFFPQWMRNIALKRFWMILNHFMQCPNSMLPLFRGSWRRWQTAIKRRRLVVLVLFNSEISSYRSWLQLNQTQHRNSIFQGTLLFPAKTRKSILNKLSKDWGIWLLDYD